VTKRTEQLGSVLHRAVQSVLERGLSDPRIRGIVTVTSVRVSPDLKAATFGVVVAPEEHEALTLHGLRSAAGHIRRRAAGLVALARLPEFRFTIDEAYKREVGTLDAIRRAVESLDDAGRAPGRPSAELTEPSESREAAP